MNSLTNKLAIITLSCLTATFNVSAEVDMTHFKSFVDNLDTSQQEKKFIALHDNFLIANKGIKADDISTRSSAQALYYLEIKGVASADYPYWESISDSAFSTTQDHGGSWIYVATIEGGYATPSSRYMRISGATLQLLQSDPIVDSGNIVIGWTNYWGTSLSSNGGTSIYQATSINSPWNTMNDNLYIQ